MNRIFGVPLLFFLLVFSQSYAMAETTTCSQMFLSLAKGRFIKDLVNGTFIFDHIVGRPSLETNDYDSFIEAIKRKNYGKILTHLNSIGVRAEIIRYRNYPFSIFKSTAIRILPEGSSEVNQLAKKMESNYGVRLFFKILGSDYSGAYSQKLNAIFVSQATAFSGKLDQVLLHEIKHAALTKKEKNGESGFSHGYAINFPWPFLKRELFPTPPGSAYRFLISFQEVRTWYQGFVYQVVHFRQKIKAMTDLNELKIYELGSLNEVGDIAPLVKSKTSFERMLSQVLSPKGIKYSERKNGELAMAFLDWRGLYYQVISKSYIDSLRRSGLLSSNPGWQKDVAVHFLKDAIGSVNNDIETILKVRSDFQTATMTVLTMLGQGRSLEDVKKLLLSVGRENFQDIEESFRLTDASQISDLPLSGINPEKMNNSEYVLEQFDFSKEQLSIVAGYHRVFGEQVERKDDYNRRLKYVFLIEKSGKTYEFVLEEHFIGSMLEESFLSALDKKGFRLIEVRALSSKFDFDMEGEKQSNELIAFTNMESEKVDARNAIRLQQILTESGSNN